MAGARGCSLPRGIYARALPSHSPPDGWNPPWLLQPLYAPAVSGARVRMAVLGGRVAVSLARPGRRSRRREGRTGDTTLRLERVCAGNVRVYVRGRGRARGQSAGLELTATQHSADTAPRLERACAGNSRVGVRECGRVCGQSVPGWRIITPRNARFVRTNGRRIQVP